MSDWRKGDLIEATKGERVIRDRAAQGEGQIWGGRLYLGTPSLFTPNTLASYEASGYELRLIERAPEPLPTEPGIYQGQHGDAWTLHRNGAWIHHGDGSLAVEWSAKDMQGINSLPLVRLRPVREVAAEVISQIANVWEFGPPANVAAWMDEVGKKFGVTS